MTKDDAIAYIEDQFSCEMGAPWHWADIGMSKPYHGIELELDVAAITLDEAEHRLVSKLIVAIDRLKKDAGFGKMAKPKLFWRWEDKVRLSPDFIATRIYIDGSPPRTHGNPSKPRGRPMVGQMMLAA